MSGFDHLIGKQVRITGPHLFACGAPRTAGPCGLAEGGKEDPAKLTLSSCCDTTVPFGFEGRVRDITTTPNRSVSIVTDDGYGIELMAKADAEPGLDPHDLPADAYDNPYTIEVLDDPSTPMQELIERLERAVVNLRELRVDGLTRGHNVVDSSRLSGKIEGVELALSYAREMV